MRFSKLLNAGVVLASALGVHNALALPIAENARGASQVTAASPAERVEFAVYLPLRHQDELDALLEELHDSKSPNYQHWLTPADFLARFGPAASDLARVKEELTSRGFTILDSNAHGMHVQGPASAVALSFGGPVGKRVMNGKTHYIARQIPSEIAGVSLRVFGLQGLPEHRVHSRVTGKLAGGSIDNRYGTTGSYWFDDLKQAYDYPAYSAQTDGTGISVAIVMADLIYPGDVAAAFHHEKWDVNTGLIPPTVRTVLIDGGGVVNGYGSFEASLDVQQVLGGAPGSTVTLLSLPDLSDDHIIDGYTHVVDTNKYDIVNSSFGECELEYTAAYNGGTDYTYILQQEHEIYQQGNAQGITFVASSGDEGGVLCPSADYGTPGATPTFVAGVSSPASDPNVTGVGGGNLITDHSTTTLDSSYVRQSAFGDPEAPNDPYDLGQNVSGGYWAAGGGKSQVFTKPVYQYLVYTASSKWRTVPDVGMQVGGLGYSGESSGIPCQAISCSPDDSSVLTAYDTADPANGGFFYTIGTSVSSPEFVGALAIYEQSLGAGVHHRVGNANYYLYLAGALQTLAGGVNAPGNLHFYRRAIPGFNGYSAGGDPSYNYDYIYGNGSPDVRKLFGLTDKLPAGPPKTPSNP